MNINSRITHHASRLTLYTCLFLGCLLLVTSTSAQQAISYQDYLSRIGRWREQVRGVQAQAGDNCAQVLGEVADEMAGISAVQMPNGAIMSVNHDGVTGALRAFPCDPARADSLLAGICPSQICPVGVVPLSNSNDLSLTGDIPTANPPQLGGTPSPDVTQQLEELLQDGQPGTEADGTGAEQPGNGDVPGSQADESGESGTDEAGGNGAVAGEGETAETGEPSSETGGETAEPDNTQIDEVDTTGEAGTGGNEGDDEGAAGEAAGEGDDTGGEGNPGTATGEAGESTASGGEGTGSTETDGAAAETASETTADTPATSQPPEIAPPVEPQRSPWLWVGVALAIVVLTVGAILFILSHPGDEVERKRQGQEPETAEEAVDEGRELVAAGNYRGAVRHLFLAALLTLDERNLIHYDKTRTNYELLDEAELRSPIMETLMPVVETFERVWYGFETVGAAEYEGLVGQIELLKQA